MIVLATYESVKISGCIVLLFSRLSMWMGFPGGSVVNTLPANAVDMGLIPGSRRSPREGNGNPCQYSCLGNHGQRSLTGYNLWGHKRVRHDLVTKQQKSRTIP